ncbi:MAG: hypothetical protein AB8C13_06735 [Phycisphaerales bacterium]
MNAHKSGHNVPHGTLPPTHPQRDQQAHWLLTAGHLAVWAMCYSVGIALVLAEFLNHSLSIQEITYVALCSHSGYLLDRVKFRDQDLDPADLMADHARHAYLRKHARWLRRVMVVEWILAMIIGAVLSPMLSVLVLAGIGAGYMYSGWKPGGVARLKDIAGLKAVLVSGAVVGLGTLTILADSFASMGTSELVDSGLPHLGALVWTVAGMALIVFGDAVICDLDDQISDCAHRTLSLPVLLGMRRAGMVGVIAVATGGLLCAAGGIGDVDLWSRWLFAAMAVVSGIWILRLDRRRDWIDARMLVVALVVWMVVV